MKCINKWKLPVFKKDGKVNFFKKLKLPKRPEKKIILGGGILGIFLLAGVIFLVFFLQKRNFDEPLPYDRSARLSGSPVQESAMVEEGMASGLCVGKSENSLEGIDGQEGEMTGLFDIRNGEIPFSQNLYQQKSLGRLGQLMTLLVAYETFNLDTSVTIQQEDLLNDLDRTCGLSARDVIPARQLLNAAAVYSAEDACFALARAAGGSTEAFVESMNTKAQELGMINTNYTNPAGLQEDEQYTTVYDTYLLLNAILGHPDLTNILGQLNYTLDYNSSGGDSKQQWLDGDNLYVTGIVSSPKGITVLGGKLYVSDSDNYGALLVQDHYGNPYVAVVLNTDNQTNLYERMGQMLKVISES